MNVAILHFTSTNVIGGVERIVAEQARIFREKGFGITVVCSRGESGPEGVKTVILKRSAGSLHDQLREVFEKHDLVLIHNVMTMPFDVEMTEALWALADDMAGVCFISWIHDVAASNPAYENIPKIFQTAHPRMQHVAVSALVQRQFCEVTGCKAELCRVIPNGLDPAVVLGLTLRVARLANKMSLFDGRLLLFHPTRLLRRKNVELGLRVVDDLRQNGQKASLLITAAADPHNPDSAVYFAELLNLRKKLNLENEVIFIGEHFEVLADDLAAFYRMADALWFPSLREGFGLPLVEAAMHRLPAFCLDIDPLRDLASGQVTFFSPETDPAVIAQKIVQLMESDPATIERKRILRKYAWPAIWEKFLKPLLEEKRLGEA